MSDHPSPGGAGSLASPGRIAALSLHGRTVAPRSSVLVELRAAKGEPAPTELRLFAAGENASTQGTFIFDAKAAKSVMAAAATRGVDFPFDYNHGSTDPLGMLNPEMSGKAAGWCSLEVRDGELWAVNIRWTKNALSAIEAKEWRYISPTFVTDKEKRVVEVLAIALTNTPALHNLEPLVAASIHRTELSMEGWVPMCLGRSVSTASLCCQACPCKVLCASLCYGATVPPDPAGGMDASKLQMSAREAGAAWEKSVADKAIVLTKKEPHMDKVHLSALGLADTASDADGLAAITALRTQLTGAKDELAKLVALSGKATSTEAAGVIQAWKTASEQVASLSARLAEAEKAAADRERDTLIQTGVKEGKLTPAMAEKWAKEQPVASLRAFLEAAPKIVAPPVVEPVKQPGAATAKAGEGEIAAQLGVSTDQLVKFRENPNPTAAAK